MEEDMYRLNECLSDKGIAEKLIDRAKDTNIIYCTNDTVLTTKAVQKLANYIERLQEENKKLEKELRIAKDTIETKDIEAYGSIPKSKVKEILEKEELPLVIVGGRRNRKTLEYGRKLGRIETCKELLGEE